MNAIETDHKTEIINYEPSFTLDVEVAFKLAALEVLATFFLLLTFSGAFFGDPDLDVAI